MRFRELDLNLLLVLDRLSREGSVSQTAQLLGLSQPTVSNALRRLRNHFEDPLFVAVGHRMVPTPFGAEVLAQTRDALATLENAVGIRDTFDPATSERVFRLVCSDYTYDVLVTRVIARLRTQAPGLSLQCFLTTEQTPDWLRKGEADLVILPRERLVADHPSERLFEDDFSCVVWTGNMRVGETISVAGFLALDHVATMLGPRRTQHLQEEAFERHDLRPRIRIYAPNFGSVAQTVIGTDLIGTMHSRAARLAAKRLPLRLIAPPVPFRAFTEMLQWHRNAHVDTGLGWLRTVFVECGRELDRPELRD